MKNINILLIIIALTVVSCSKLDSFLDKEPSSDKSYVSTLNDCDLILNNPSLIGGFHHTFYLDDCLAFSDVAQIFSEGSGEYNEYSYWTDTKYIVNSSADDKGWNGLYSNIYYSNVIINSIDNVSGNDDTQREQFKGEGYLGRAYYHFMAVNMYAKEYDPKSASTDAGVPYVTDIDTQGKRERATVKEVYDNIIVDLTHAIEFLKTVKPVQGKNHRGNMAAANALMAKVYFHMQDWAKAEEYALKSLTNYGSLVDYNNYNNTESFVNSDNYNSFKNIETTYLKGCVETFEALYIDMSIRFGMFMGGLHLTDDFVNKIDKSSDLRYRLFMGEDMMGQTTFTSTKSYDDMFWGSSSTCGCTTSEIYYLLAECYARQGKLSDACNTLSNIMRTRYDKLLFKDYSSSDKSAIIEKICNERWIDFAYTGSRWFDMRRLNTLGEYNKTITRKNGDGTLTWKMIASPSRMVLPIPKKLTDINPNITQNPFE